MNKKFILGLAIFFGGLALAGTDPSNTFRLGDGSPSKDKKIIINQGTAPYPALKWNSTSSTLQFSNDGVAFSDLGSGSGSGQGFNVLVNPDFESGIVQGWTNSGGTFAAATSGSNLLLGKTSAVFTASGSAQFVASAAYLVPNGLLGRSCSVGMLYKGGDENLKIEAFDGTNVLATQTLFASTKATPVAVPFLCPSSGTIQLRVKSTASSALIALDQMFLGENVIQQVSQATYYGGVVVAASCGFINSATGTYADLAEISTTCDTGNVLLGNASSFANTGNGGVTFNSLPPGEYLAKFQGTCTRGNASANSLNFIMTDGTTYSTGREVFHGTAGVLNAPCQLESHFSYTTSGNRTFKVQAFASGSDSVEFTNSAITFPGELFSLYRFPTQTEAAVRPETINWRAAGVFTSTTNNFSLTTSTVSSFTEIHSTSNAATYTADPNTISSFPACDGTNSPSDSTCSTTGNKPDYSIVFNQPASGTDKVCFTFSPVINVGTSQSVTQHYKIVQTPSNSQTILQSGTNIQAVQLAGGSTSGSGNETISVVTLCDNLNISSAGQTTFRLFYIQTNASGNPSEIFITDASANQNAKVEVTPVTQNIPAPVIVYSPSAFSVSRTTADSASGPSVVLPFDIIEYDSSNTWDSTNKWWVVPVTGLYIVTGQINISDSFSYGAANTLVMDLFKNGTGLIEMQVTSTLNDGFGTGGSKIVQLTAGDHIYMKYRGICSTDSLCHWATATLGASILH